MEANETRNVPMGYKRDRYGVYVPTGGVAPIDDVGHHVASPVTRITELESRVQTLEAIVERGVEK